MNKLTIISAVVFALYGTTTHAQSSFATNNSLPQNQTLGFNGTGPGGAKDLEIRNDYNRPIEFYTNGLQRMFIRQGGGGLNGGLVAMGNNLPNNFAPQARLHLHHSTVNPTAIGIRFSSNLSGAGALDGYTMGYASVNNPHVYFTSFELNTPFC